MSITLNDLLAWSERLPDQNGEEARMLQRLIERREAELRARIADLIAAVSERENWKLHRCAAAARRVERMPREHLETAHDYFCERAEGRPHFDAADVFIDLFADEESSADGKSASSQAKTDLNHASARATPSAPIVDFYGRMQTLESRLADTPGITCGIQGIRIMRMVALMSKARSAQLANLRISGTQAVYRHM